MRARLRWFLPSAAVALAGVCAASFHGQTKEHCVSCAAAAGRSNEAAFDHFRKGLELATQGRFAEAEAEYRETLRLDPNNPDYHALLGDALAAQGKSEAAKTQYQQEQKLKQSGAKPAARKPSGQGGSGKNGTIVSSPAKPPSRQVPGTNAGTRSPGSKASSPNTLAAGSPSSQSSNSGRISVPPHPAGRNVVITERGGAPFGTNGRTITIRPGAGGKDSSSDDSAYREVVALLDKGEDLAASGKYAEAEALYRKALARMPKIADGWQDLGRACLAQKKWSEAVQAFRQAVLLTDEAEFHADLAEALLRAGKREEAVSEAKTAIKKGLETHSVYKELGLP